jgi:diguanylate cyclase (GGDEF)-like protein
VIDNFAFLLPVIHLTFGCTLLIVWRAGSRVAAIWGCGFLGSAIGFSVPLLQFLPMQGRAMVADIAFATAFLCFGQGLVRRFGLRRRLALRSAVALASVGGCAWAIFVLGSLRFELIASDMGCALLILVCLPGVLGRLRRPIDRVLITITLLVVLDTVIRGATVFLTTPTDSPADFLTTDYAFLMQASGAVLGLLFALVVLAAVTLDHVAFYRIEATVDPLSGLLNRRGFEHAIAGRHSGALRWGSVVIADMDHFKQVNDQCGHSAGDRAIVVFARLLSDTMPSDSVIARFGGEEFITFLPKHDPAVARGFAETLRHSFAESGARLAELPLPVTASFGIAEVEPGDFSIHDAIARADAGLYQAKANGRDRIVVHVADPAGSGLMLM